MIAVNRYAALAETLLLISVFFAVQGSSSSTEAAPESLSSAAHQTYANFINAYNRGEEKAQPQAAEVEIPARYWADPIKALKPLKVYIHRVNIVVVQRIQNGIEEGKYIYILVSSYLPHNGDDGFEFTPNPQRNNLYYAADEVLEYKRARGK